MNPVVVGISGASGSVIAKKTVDALLQLRAPTVLICSNDSKLVWREEMDETFGYHLSAWSEDPNFSTYGINEMNAPIASGTYPTRGMVIVPCSMKSAASLSHGITNNLLLRTADVCLKERRNLILIPRETPLHAIHLENLARLANMGAVIMPPDPPFYLKPQSIDDVVDFIVERILVSLGLVDMLTAKHIYSGPTDKI